MTVPPLPIVSHANAYISGNVTIDPSAVIAPGVILRADPAAQIVIQAGVCIGMGAVLHAYQGKIEVERGSNLGPGVLIVGQSQIGANTCVGAATTIFNASIASIQVIPAGSVIGDTSRRIPVAGLPDSDQGNGAVVSSPSTSQRDLAADLRATHIGRSPPPDEEASAAPASGGLAPDTSRLDEDPWDSEAEFIPQRAAEPASDQTAQTPKQDVNNYIGQVYVNRLMVTLFPHNQSLKNHDLKDATEDS